MKNLTITGRNYRLGLAVVILLSSASVIALNFYSVKMLSAIRAYINGEAMYSKAQKDAVQHLTRYIYTDKEIYYTKFQESLKIPLADKAARLCLQSKMPYSQVKGAFMAGQNHPSDVQNIIWLFRNFNHLHYFKQATHHWKKADEGISQLNRIAEIIRRDRRNAKHVDNESYLEKISWLNSYMDGHEKQFSEILGGVSRKIARMVFYLNLIFVLLIFLNVGLFVNNLMKKLNRARELIEEQNRVKEEFLSVASHELKSPITFMKASIQILERFAKNTPETIKIHPFIVNSGKQIERLNHLVQELLDVTKIQSGKLSLNKQAFPLAELVTEAIEVKKQNHTHHLLIKELHQVTVNADSNRIYQVLENLLSNAMKYSSPDTEVMVWSVLEDKMIKICIHDEGKGIVKEKIPMLFDRFYRVESTQQTVQGLGLGLYICSEIIKAHNGTIGVDSVVNEGSTFWFALPVANEPGEEPHLA
jgi:signal transduction histidine kinase